MLDNNTLLELKRKVQDVKKTLDNLELMIHSAYIDSIYLTTDGNRSKNLRENQSVTSSLVGGE